MRKIHEVEVEGEKIYMKRGSFGFRVVHPIKNDDGSWNWINLLIGGKGNFIILLIVLAIIFLFLFGVKQMLESCNDMAENPCDYFDVSSCSEDITIGDLTPTINFPSINDIMFVDSIST